MYKNPCIYHPSWVNGVLRVHVGKPVGLTLVFEPLRTYIGTLELEQVFLCRSNRKVCANRRQPVYKHFGRKEELLSVKTNGIQQEFTVSNTNSTSEPRTHSVKRCRVLAFGCYLYRKLWTDKTVSILLVFPSELFWTTKNVQKTVWKFLSQPTLRFAHTLASFLPVNF